MVILGILTWYDGKTMFLDLDFFFNTMVIPHFWTWYHANTMFLFITQNSIKKMQSKHIYFCNHD